MDDIFKTALQISLPGRFTQKELAEKVGMSVSYFNDLYKGRKKGQEQVRRDIASALGYDDYESFLDIGRQALGIKTLRYQGNSPLIKNDSPEGKNFFGVPFYEHMRRSTETGIYADRADENQQFMIYGPSFGRSEAGNLNAFRVGGDSMEPIIAKGGIVLADMAQNDIQHLIDGRIYIVCWKQGEGQYELRRVKWVEKGQTVAIETENMLRDTVYRRVSEVSLMGRVIWSCRNHH